ncbi:MAG: hypothetical protein MMC33_010158 [Icmadophila ericetorum]|nr:hypothetical protein [Icmadophila ericetorum]
MASNEQIPPPPQGVSIPTANTQQLQSAPSGPQPSPGGSIDSLQCQWQGCGERADSAEQLYEHVCERHVGRKSTNNLNLQCAWGTCRTATVKRDHITSHIRVHVPLKPHKCDFCGKSFKRPQDLKKHVKTHADDSVIMHSPEPSNAARQHQGGYNMSQQPRPAGFFGDGSMQTNVPMGGYYPGPAVGQGYYAPTQQPASTQYGPVYYSINQNGDVGNHNSYDSRKRGLDSLNDFFGDAKRRAFDPTSYAQVGSRLVAVQGIQLPLPSGGGMGDYQPIQSMATIHGGVYGPTAAPNYALPSMPNLRTKSDLVNMDNLLEQMTAAAYESSNGQSNGHHVSIGLGIRRESPPNLQLPTSHMSMGAESNHGTPDLTPSSTVYSSHSPTSDSNSQYSPPNRAMYPVLPTSTSASGPNMMASTTLGNQYNADPRRRHSGGTLQRAQPGNDDAMYNNDDTSTTPGASTRSKRRTTNTRDLNIDPALAGPSTASSNDSPASSARLCGSMEGAEDKWVKDMRFLEGIRELIKDKLMRGDYEEDDEEAERGNKEDRERQEKGERGRGREEGERMDIDRGVSGESLGMGESLYPVLREVGVGAE